MENINNISENTAKAPTPKDTVERTNAYLDFINVLSQIIEKHGAEVLCEINHVK